MALSKNAALLRALLVKADELACGVANNEFPVLLRSIAERRRVTGVEFQPLLVNAALTIHPTGFRIIFNSNGGDAAYLQQLYQSECHDRLMPPRVRFSLAHELAHTFFYDLSEDRPRLERKFRAGGGRTALDNLERNCNRLASRLLLPSSMLRKQFGLLPKLTAEAFCGLARRAGVSVEVLVRRFSESTSLFGARFFRGSIVLLKQTDDEAVISAVAKPEHVNIAQELILMRPGERWQLGAADGKKITPESFLTSWSVALTLGTKLNGKSTQPYQVTTMETGRFGNTVSHLLIFEAVEVC